MLLGMQSFALNFSSMQSFDSKNQRKNWYAVFPQIWYRSLEWIHKIEFVLVFTLWKTVCPTTCTPPQNTFRELYMLEAVLLMWALRVMPRQYMK